MHDFSNRVSSFKTIHEGIKSEDSIPVRVVDVILDPSHPEWVKFGGDQAVGAIKYTTIGSQKNTDDVKTLSVAFPINPNIKTYPLKNEIVFVRSAPGILSTNVSEMSRINYYESAVNVWNSRNHNGSPVKGTEDIDLGTDIDEIGNINPMQPFPGDTLLEGRLGQSIRFTGYPHKLNPFVNKDNKNRPLTIISNGQIETESGIEHIVENIDEDSSSIYLTSNHSIPLTPAKNKRLAFTEKPVIPASYQGSQVLVNGGRLYFNAKEEDIHLNALGNIGLSSKIVGIDAEDYIGLDAKKIYLGQKARRFENQPVLLGNSVELWFNSLLAALDRVGTSMISAANNAGPVVSLNKEGVVLKAQLKLLKDQTNPQGESQLKSRKVFTE